MDVADMVLEGVINEPEQAANPAIGGDEQQSSNTIPYMAHIDNRDHFSTVILTSLSRGQKMAIKYGSILSYSVCFNGLFCRRQD